MQVDIDRLWRYHEDGKLRHGSHPSRDLHVWCYSQSTVYNRDWDDLTRLCRGLVTNGEGFVISRPFPKFYNWGEPEAPSDLSRSFIAYDKMDGSLLIVGNDEDGSSVVSTKGSFTTWHSERARELIGSWSPKNGMTAIFEFIDPMNRIVVDYGEYSGLTLLGAVDNETGEDHFTPDDVAETMGWTGDIVTSRNFKLVNMLSTMADLENGTNREGFVLVYPEMGRPSERVKLKFAQYVNLHRMLSRLNNVAVWEALMSGTFDDLLDVVPDELYDKVRECANELDGLFQAKMFEAKADATLASALFETRKEQAAWVIDNSKVSSLTFKVLDNRDITTLAWAAVKPELDREWQFLK